MKNKDITHNTHAINEPLDLVFNTEYVSEDEIPKSVFKMGRFFPLKIELRKKLSKWKGKHAGMKLTINIPGTPEERETEVKAVVSAVTGMFKKENWPFRFFYSKENDAFYIAQKKEEKK